ncbi:MAG: MFS transporter [Cyanobacteria bacterium P01_C01_bin.73]
MSQASTQPSDQIPPLSLGTKLAYGAGDMGAGITQNLIAFSSLIFLTSVAGLSPGAAGTVLLIGKAWDAVNDPMVGVLSDRTQSRWGRRYPWIFISALPFGLTFFLTWIVPGFAGPQAKFWYYVITSVLFQIFFTTVNLPYTTLTAELSQDYDERTELTTFRLAFSLTGAIAALALGLVISGAIANLETQYLVLGGACAVIAVIPIFWCIFGTYPRFQRQRSQLMERQIKPDLSTTMPVAQQLKVAFSNRAFLFVIGIYLFAWLALQVTASILPFYVTYWMEQDDYFLAALLVQGTAIIMMFGCNWVSKQVGKRGLFFLGSGVWLLVQVGLFFLQPGQLGLMYGLCVLVSVGVATAYVVPWAMLPDVIELDELETGERREGIFYAFMTFLQKLGLAVGLWLVGQALERSGFVADAPSQVDSALLAIRLFMGIVPMVLLICALILAYFYPLTREIHAEILLKLQARRDAGTKN